MFDQAEAGELGAGAFERTAGDDVSLSIRVKEPAEKVCLTVGDILRKNLRIVKPSEMVKVHISPREYGHLDEGTVELLVSCKSKN